MTTKKAVNKSQGDQLTTIRITPSWRFAMSVYIEVIAQHGHGEKAKQARAELMRLADYIDNLNINQ